MRKASAKTGKEQYKEFLKSQAKALEAVAKRLVQLYLETLKQLCLLFRVSKTFYLPAPGFYIASFNKKGEYF